MTELSPEDLRRAAETGDPPSPAIPFIDRHGITPLAFASICLVFLFLLYQVVGGTISFLLFGLSPGPEDIFGLRAVTGLGQLLLLFLPTLLLVRLVSFSPREYLRLRAPRLQPVLLALLGIISLQQILQIYLVLQDKIPLPEELGHQLDRYREMVEESMKMLVGAGSVPELLWVILVIALIPAVVEEFLFRGLIQRSIERGSSPIHGAIVTGIVFGAYHLLPSSIVPLSLLGIYLGFLAYRSDCLWVSVIAHFFNNAVACVATYLRMDDNAVLTGNPKEMSLAMLLGTLWFFGILFLLTTYYFFRVTGRIDEDPSSPTGSNA